MRKPRRSSGKPCVLHRIECICTRAGSGFRHTNGQQRKWGDLSGECCSSTSGLRQSCGSPAVRAGALKLAPASQGVESEAALAFAMAGDTARADSLAQDLGKRFPLDTQMQSLWLPAIHARLAQNRKNPALILNVLQAASAIELGQILLCLLSGVCARRGIPGSRTRQCCRRRVSENSRPQRVVWNCWTGALAHLGVSILRHRNHRQRCPSRLARIPKYILR